MAFSLDIVQVAERGHLAWAPHTLVSMRRGPSFGEDCTSARNVHPLTTRHKLEQLPIEIVLAHTAPESVKRVKSIAQILVKNKMEAERLSQC